MVYPYSRILSSQENKVLILVTMYITIETCEMKDSPEGCVLCDPICSTGPRLENSIKIKSRLRFVFCFLFFEGGGNKVFRN